VHDTPSPLRNALRQVTMVAGVPYGFTLTVWSIGAVTVHRRGIPDTLDALLFLAGAVVSFVALEVATHGGWHAQPAGPTPRQLWTHAHVLSAGGAVLVVGALDRLPLGAGTWALAGCAGTTTFLVSTAWMFVLAARRDGSASS
jgi:hypothetical protein